MNTLDHKIESNLLPLVLWIVYGVMLIQQAIDRSTNQKAIVYFTLLFFGTALLKYFHSKEQEWWEYGTFLIVLITILVFF